MAALDGTAVEPLADDAERYDELPMALPSAVASCDLPPWDPNADAIAHNITAAAIPEVPIFVQDKCGPAACLLVRSGLACLGWLT
ncbi:MAG TPA: hypothetical protein VGL75_00700 [Acidothermaceae bacterium]|jgi:hypothetical protein